MRLLVTCCACIASVLSVFVPAAAGTETGAVAGAVVVGPRLVERKMRFNLYPDLRRDEPPRPAYSEQAELANVVVHLIDHGGTLDRMSQPTGARTMEQRESTFRPHVLPVVVGTTVEFPNFDPVFHNVFSLSRAARFDLGRYPRGSTRSRVFDRPGVVKVFCHIHSDMTAVVMVLPNSFFGQPDEDGRYRIDGIPPGEYELVAWHERARRVSRMVTIRAGETADVDFSIPLEVGGQP